MKTSLSSLEFKKFYKKSNSLKIDDLLIKYKNMNSPKLGFIVSKAYGNSVKRNLFKRRCKSLFKTKFLDNKKNISLIIEPKKQNISYYQLSTSFCTLYEKIFN